MNDNQASNTLNVVIAPEYENDDSSLVTGLIIFLNGFIIQNASMKYVSYNIQLKLDKDDGPLINNLSEKNTVGDTVKIYVVLDDIEYCIYFMITAEMIDFCEEWKNKNFCFKYCDDSPTHPSFSIN